MNYKAADRCMDCPKSNDENGCPWWWEIVESHDGNISVRKDCGKRMLPFILIELTKALLRPQAAMESMRNVLKPLMDILAGTGHISVLRIGHERTRLGNTDAVD